MGCAKEEGEWYRHGLARSMARVDGSDDMYFWCSSGEDGTLIEEMQEADVRKRLQQIEKVTFLSQVPESDGCWIHVSDDAVLLIKGEAICPKVEKTGFVQCDL